MLRGCMLAGGVLMSLGEWQVSNSLNARAPSVSSRAVLETMMESADTHESESMHVVSDTPCAAVTAAPAAVTVHPGRGGALPPIMAGSESQQGSDRMHHRDSANEMGRASHSGRQLDAAATTTTTATTTVAPPAHLVPEAMCGSVLVVQEWIPGSSTLMDVLVSGVCVWMGVCGGAWCAMDVSRGNGVCVAGGAERCSCCSNTNCCN